MVANTGQATGGCPGESYGRPPLSVESVSHTAELGAFKAGAIEKGTVDTPSPPRSVQRLACSELPIIRKTAGLAGK